MADPLRLYGLRALVTHAADGIGGAVARTPAKHGASVFAVDGGPMFQYSDPLLEQCTRY